MRNDQKLDALDLLKEGRHYAPPRGWSVGQWIAAGVFVVLLALCAFVVYGLAVGQVPFQ